MTNLTPKQRRIYDFIRTFTRRQVPPPPCGKSARRWGPPPPR